MFSSARVRKHVQNVLRLNVARQPNGCWLWTGTTTKCGYGVVHFDSKTKLVHRVNWTLLKGPIPAGMQVLHNCPAGDNRACCNPGHLWLGTHRQNMEDMRNKKRNATGEKHGRAKLTEAKVRKIKKRIRLKHTLKDIAADYSVAPSLIFWIKHGKYWKHIA